MCVDKKQKYYRRAAIREVRPRAEFSSAARYFISTTTTTTKTILLYTVWISKLFTSHTIKFPGR